MINKLKAIVPLLFFSCITLGMDTDEIETSYTFPSLIEVHEYPIRIYPQKNKKTPQSKIRRPLGVVKKVYKKLEKLTKRLEEAKLNLHLQNLENKKNQKIEKKVLGEGLYGKFCIYNAINHDKKFKNPWYCIFRMNLDADTRQARRQALLNKPHDAWDEQHLIPFDKQLICDQTLKQMVQFLSHEEDEEEHIFLDIGPYYAYTYLLDKQGQKWESSQRQSHTVREPLRAIDADYLYRVWPEHETRDQARRLLNRKKLRSMLRQDIIAEQAEQTDSSSTSASSQNS